LSDLVATPIARPIPLW